MKIALGADHGGFVHKERIADYLKKNNHEVIDFGCHNTDSCDYPLISKEVALSVSKGQTERGILLCGTGVGMSIVANKIKGIRAACCWSDAVAMLVSQHNMSNVLCLPGRYATSDQIIRWIDIWLSTPYSTEERHKRRIGEIAEIEKEFFK